MGGHGMNTQATKLQAAEMDLKQLMADVAPEKLKTTSSERTRLQFSRPPWASNTLSNSSFISFTPAFVRPGRRSNLIGRAISRFSSTGESSGEKAVAKHRQPALGFGFSRFVLQDIPVLSETAIFDAHDIGGDPVPRPTVA
jgi:hypothetical protein